MAAPGRVGGAGQRKAPAEICCFPPRPGANHAFISTAGSLSNRRATEALRRCKRTHPREPAHQSCCDLADPHEKGRPRLRAPFQRYVVRVYANIVSHPSADQQAEGPNAVSKALPTCLSESRRRESARRRIRLPNSAEGSAIEPGERARRARLSAWPTKSIRQVRRWTSPTCGGKACAT